MQNFLHASIKKHCNWAALRVDHSKCSSKDSEHYVLCSHFASSKQKHLSITVAHNFWYCLLSQPCIFLCGFLKAESNTVIDPASALQSHPSVQWDSPSVNNETHLLRHTHTHTHSYILLIQFIFQSALWRLYCETGNSLSFTDNSATLGFLQS